MTDRYELFRMVAGASGDAIEWRGRGETLRVEPWGTDSVRVRCARGPVRDDLPGALLAPSASAAVTKIEGGSATIVNGAVTVVLDTAHVPEKTNAPILRFLKTSDGSELLTEEPIHFWWPGPRLFTANGNGYYRLEQKFRAYDDEKLYGLGQHQHGLLDQKGAVVDLVQRNAEVSIPVLLSSRGYGLLWNNPAIGRVELGASGTRWVADSARQIDYWFTAGEPADVARNYADATGHAPEFPEWASGFWQCKLRYRTQEELLEVARGYRRRGLPLSVIVCDFFHWTHLGDWKFDPEEWPDPAAAVRELDELGIKLMVSVWPSVSPLSENYRPLTDRGLLISTESGPMAHADWPDKGADDVLPVAFYDATNPEARAYLWERIERNYLAHGVKVFWLDACEPELVPAFQGSLRYDAGPGLEVGNMYPRENSRAFHDGMVAAGETEIVTMNRSAWAGSQRYGAALWSGDIHPDFASLKSQVKAGIHVAASGIPWWNTDIGGFDGGDPDDPAYREVLVRWFQFGVFSPIMRLHGYRVPHMELGPRMTGGPNEVWSYGDEAYAILTSLLELREKLRPYIGEQMQVASAEGLPVFRPLFMEFPADPTSWTVADQYLFGRDILVAPVVEAGARTREVYLPAGAEWTDHWTGSRYPGGAPVVVDAPLERIPFFLRDDAAPLG
jgi:alpha-D-xyloside xylohydrolase